MSDNQRIELRFQLNGESVQVRVHPSDRLLDLLRYDLGLPGTKEGCGEGECGACTVLMDGVPANSCLIPAYQVRGRAILTIESAELADVEPLLAAGTTQCGACTPGVVMTARWIRDHPELLERFGSRQLMAGNLCRCTGYDGIIDGLLTLVGTDKAT